MLNVQFDLVVIAGREQSDLSSVSPWRTYLLDHPRQRPRGVCTAREPKEIHLVARAVIVHQVLIRFAHKVVKVATVSHALVDSQCETHIDNLGRLVLDVLGRGKAVWQHGTQARRIVHQLRLVDAKHRHELDDIAVARRELVAGTVEADDNVA